MKSLNWYFDFISPFAYLQYVTLREQGLIREINARPVLFAGLLKHWGHKGPVEIPAKRAMTYQHCHWLAEKHGIPFKTPPYHPFHPLMPLRLTLSMDCDPDLIDFLFRGIWEMGLDPASDGMRTLVRQTFGDIDIEDRCGNPEVKAALVDSTQKAIEVGVFGVPTLQVGNRLFWGFDMTEMALEFAHGNVDFKSGEYGRLEQLPGMD
ncbi:MAG: DsbA family protein [Pseudomonadota bacterium]